MRIAQSRGSVPSAFHHPSPQQLPHIDTQRAALELCTGGRLCSVHKAWQRWLHLFCLQTWPGWNGHKSHGTTQLPPQHSRNNGGHVRNTLLQSQSLCPGAIYEQYCLRSQSSKRGMAAAHLEAGKGRHRGLGMRGFPSVLVSTPPHISRSAHGCLLHLAQHSPWLPLCAHTALTFQQLLWATCTSNLCETRIKTSQHRHIAGDAMVRGLQFAQSECPTTSNVS